MAGTLASLLYYGEMAHTMSSVWYVNVYLLLAAVVALVGVLSSAALAWRTLVNFHDVRHIALVTLLVPAGPRAIEHAHAAMLVSAVYFVLGVLAAVLAALLWPLIAVAAGLGYVVNRQATNAHAAAAYLALTVAFLAWVFRARGLYNVASLVVFGLVALDIVEWWRAPPQAHAWRDEPLYALLDRAWAAGVWTKAFLGRPLQPKKKHGAQDAARAARE